MIDSTLTRRRERAGDREHREDSAGKFMPSSHPILKKVDVAVVAPVAVFAE